MEIPLVDLRPWFEGNEKDRTAVARSIDTELQRLGFLVVENHGIDPDVLTNCREHCRAFFRQSASEKRKVQYTGGAYRGWVPPDSESNAATLGEDTPPDGKETFAFGPVDVHDADLRAKAERWYAPNVWPVEADSAFRSAGESWWRSARHLADELISIAEVALGLDAGTMASQCTSTVATGAMHWYWPADVRSYSPGQYRIGPHTDFGTFTVLDRQVGTGGLEVLDPEGSWIEAPDVPGSLIVNTGDLMKRWTNDRWASNFHRVAAPAEDAHHEELISLVFFHGPNHDAVIEPLGSPEIASRRYTPIRADEYFATKMDELASPSDTPQPETP